jgi:dTDP-glucose 4,6-dehydratase
LKILVTGSSGFIGRHRIRHLKSQGHTVIGISNTHKDDVSDIKLSVDISKKDALKYILSRERPDRIEHFASVAVVGVSRQDPYSTYETNVLGAVGILQNALEIGIKDIMLFTTDKVTGDRLVSNEEDIPIIMSGAYETSKLAQDVVGRSYQKQGLNISIMRSCNVFGPDDPNRRIVPNTIRTIQQGKQPTIFDNIVGVRQYIYIKDLLSALDFILRNRPNEIFNIGTDIHYSQQKVVEEICEIWNDKYHTEVKPEYISGPNLNEIASQVLDWSKLHLMEWHPRYSFSDGIKEMLMEK